MNAASAGPIVGVILAGGRSRRMGAEKAFARLGGRPLIAHAVARLRPQVDALIVNANGDPSRFDALGLAVVGDSIGGFAGPLAGILAGMDWTARNRPDARLIVTVPADTPFIPGDLVSRLAAATTGPGTVAVARSPGGIHPVVAAFGVSQAEPLRHFIGTAPSLKVADWLARHGPALVDFAASGDGADPFFNVNTPDDLKVAETLLAARLPGRIG